MAVSAMPATATMPAAATAMPTTATTMPFGMSGRRSQQTGGYRGRDQQGFEAHHVYHPYISADREGLDQPQALR